MFSLSDELFREFFHVACVMLHEFFTHCRGFIVWKIFDYFECVYKELYDQKYDLTFYFVDFFFCNALRVYRFDINKVLVFGEQPGKASDSYKYISRYMAKYFRVCKNLLCILNLIVNFLYLRSCYRGYQFLTLQVYHNRIRNSNLFFPFFLSLVFGKYLQPLSLKKDECSQDRRRAANYACQQCSVLKKSNFDGVWEWGGEKHQRDQDHRCHATYRGNEDKFHRSSSILIGFLGASP